MNKKYKYIVLYILSMLSIFLFFKIIDDWYDKNVELQKNILVKQAQTHFNDQVNTRKWNALYGGVYAIPHNGQKPNPYLKEGTLKVDDNLTLIKINPAWMTRQLSELLNIKGFDFRITSLKPINPNNKASEFEKRALEYLEQNNKKEYYEFEDKDKFKYMGALVTEQPCLQCHANQGYKLGDIRGGISVSLSNTEYVMVISDMKKRVLISKLFIILFFSIITFLLHQQFKSNEELSKKVDIRTKEINETKKLLQNILDANKSFIIVSDGAKIIFANETLLKFVGIDSLNDIDDNHKKISEKFKKLSNDNFCWLEYLKNEQINKELKVFVKNKNTKLYFKPHSKKIIIENKTLYLITFDEITDEYIKIEELENEASTDPLTKLFNRRKFNNILDKEIELSNTINSPLSLIFLDIDHFKSINDTLGHDVGDVVLIEISKIISQTIRRSDFVSRWGGEEFIITLQADVTQASILAQELRIAVKKHLFGTAGHITISLGVTMYKKYENKESFIKRVDEALYEAKESGRNRVVIK